MDMAQKGLFHQLLGNYKHMLTKAGNDFGNKNLSAYIQIKQELDMIEEATKIILELPLTLSE